MNTRALSIAQGFVILTALTYLIKEERYLPSLFVSFFGIAFTVVLSSLQKNYWLHFTAILDTVVDEMKRSEDHGWHIESKETTDIRSGCGKLW